MMEEICPDCHGEGEWHDCGEDTCCCLNPEPNEYCEHCDGEGWVFVEYEY